MTTAHNPVSPLDMQFEINWINNCRHTNPKLARTCLSELGETFRSPETNRGTVPLHQYLALTKKERHAEKDGPAFIPAVFTKPATRDQDDVHQTTGFVLDFDGNVTREEFEPKLKQFGYIAYTTYSHSDKSERWRVLLPYSEPASPAVHRQIYQHFYKLFDGHLDSRAETLNQLPLPS